MIKLFLFFFLSAFSSINLYAANWHVITIPGAKCGNGEPYNVLIQKRNSKKLLVEFMGGGACWDRDSCFKRFTVFPWLGNYPVIDSYSVFTTNDPNINPFVNHSKIYFSYCTADVHAGEHLAVYDGLEVYHYGAKNIRLAFDYLAKEGLLNFSQFEELAIYGASAGGIASLTHGKFIEGYLEKANKKTMIVDSPGLHFGESFWHKFGPQMLDDFKKTFSRNGLEIDVDDGVVSRKMAPVLERYEDWQIGIIIGLRDIVMTEAFGDISQEDHKELVLGPDGLPSIARPYPNIHFWLRDTAFHTFLLTRLSAAFRSDDGQSVFDFVHSIYYGYQHH